MYKEMHNLPVIVIRDLTQIGGIEDIHLSHSFCLQFVEALFLSLSQPSMAALRCAPNKVINEMR